MNKLVKSVKKLTKKMTLTHLLVALLVVALVVAVVHSQRNQENFSWWSWYSNYWKRQQEAIAEAARAAARAAQVAAAKKVALTSQYTRKDWKMQGYPHDKDTNISMNRWIVKHLYYLKNQDNGKEKPLDGTWDTKCAWRGKLDRSITPVDLDVEEANLKAIGEPNVYKDLNFKKCQAICDFHSAPETSKGQWGGGCVGFNITHQQFGSRAAECVFYSNQSVGYRPTQAFGLGLTKKLNDRMRSNWDKNAKKHTPETLRKATWWGLKNPTAKWTYWPREELKTCQ